MAFDFKKFFSDFFEEIKKVNPFAPAFSYGSAKEVWDRGKDEVGDIIKPFTMPLLLIVIILILLLVFWKKIQKLLGI